jgi:3-hydroxyisobutyrate dehydrogenase-like beta-hydroxyacid dehydrogenase
MATVAFLGTGLMGSAMIEAMLKRGDSVRAWNRTLERARPLEKLGARIAKTPAEAVAGAERVHILVSDDAAVDGVLDAMRPGLARDAIVVDHTTVSPAGTVARFAWCDRYGIQFLHAPVFMGPQHCRDAHGLMLCSGPRALFARAEPALQAMTGKLWFVGERRDLAAGYKLVGNAMILVITGGLADVYQMAAQLGIPATEAHGVFTYFKPAGTIDARGKNMAEGNFKPSFELVMARKDVRLMIEAAGTPPLTMLSALARRMDEVIAKGNGHDDVGVIVKDRLGGPGTAR